MKTCDDDWGPIFRIGLWELWPETNRLHLMLTRDRVVKWEWVKRNAPPPIVIRGALMRFVRGGEHAPREGGPPYAP